MIPDYSRSGPAGLHEGPGGEDARPPAAVREVPQVDRQGAAHPGRSSLQDRRRRVQGRSEPFMIFVNTVVQGDHSGCDKPPIDIKTKVVFHGPHTKTELLF